MRALKEVCRLVGRAARWERRRDAHVRRWGAISRPIATLAPVLLLILALVLPSLSVGGPLTPLEQPYGEVRASTPNVVQRRDGSYVVEIPVDREVQHQVFTLKAEGDRKDRLVIDLPEVRWVRSAAAAARPEAVSGVRTSRFRAGRSRLVVDVDRPVSIVSSDYIASPGWKPARIEVVFRLGGQVAMTGGLQRGGALPASRPAPLLAQRSRGAAEAEGSFATNSIPATRHRIQSSYAPAFAPTPIADPRRARRRPFIVMIDPGHGGDDPGAIYGGVAEKDIVLAVAQDLRRRLHVRGRVHVYLTRNADITLSLSDRVDKVRRMRADLFISLHADALPSNPRVTGASIYTLGETTHAAMARTPDAHRRSSSVGYAELEDELIAAQLAQGVGVKIMRESQAMADLFISEFRRSGLGLLRRRPHRNANFYVLRNIEIPSVLIELGFLTSRHDRRRLATEAWRDEAVGAIARAVRRWTARDYPNAKRASARARR